MKNGSFISKQRKGVIKLIPKKDKNLLKVANWRPITLLNVDYKILSKTLANRLKSVLGDIIHEDQAGFLKGRYIGENIRCILDVAEYLSANNGHGILISVDLEFAFDSVDRSFMYNTLLAFGIPEKFANMVFALYEGAYSTVCNNGYETPSFFINRGVRQGDSMSAYLFIMVIETLANAIRKNENIKGIQVYDIIFKILLYADDATIFLQDKDSMEHVIDLITKFGLCSGLRINKHKTAATGLGNFSKLNEKLHEVWIRPEPLKILGLWFSHCKKKMHDLNVTGKMSRMKAILNTWFTRRGLTLQGKIMTAKTLGVSLLTYPLMNLTVTQKCLKEIDKTVFSYIWGDTKKTKIRRDVMIQDYANGGLKAPDIFSMEKMWKLSWIQRLQSLSSGKWKTFALRELEKFGGFDYLLGSNFDAKLLPFSLTDFWQTVFSYYSYVDEKPVKTWQDVRLQFINNNKHILVGKKSVYLASLKNSGKDQIRDWFTSSGKPNTYDCMKKSIPKLTWLQYLQIISAIPKQWKQLLTDSNRNRNESERFMYSKENAKKKLIQSQLTAPIAGVKHWSEKYENVNWSKLFILARQMTRETKLQIFQYKILHQIIATKEKLYNWKKVESKYCANCPEFIHDTEHLFFSCPKSLDLWNSFQQLFIKYENKQIELNSFSILFGLKSIKSEIQFWNYFILLLKFFIYKCHIRNTICDWTAAKNYLRTKLKIDMYIAKKHNLTNLLNQLEKWKPFLNNED